ncbi:MAG TPA: hypothetical protein VJH03_11940 [Blastocatellia bacterium]|nr:hypothetical protein [Blastocatellia bacterium]
MRKFLSYSLLTTLALIGSQVRADTLHLKNGSVIKGKVTSFADDQFVVMLDAGSGRFLSKAQIYIGDVARIEFDSATTSPAESAPPTRIQPANPQPDVVAPRENPPPPKTDPPVKPSDETQPKTADPPATKPPTPEPEPTQTEKLPTVTAPTTETPDAKPADQVVASATVDVAAKRDWTSTGLLVKRGDKIRITATGMVTLDATGGHTSGPEGIDLPDSRKLMGDRPTGALIAVIGADNDDFILVGKQAEFFAARDGLLFLSVNEGALSDNSGVYKATIEVQTKRSPAR